MIFQIYRSLRAGMLLVLVSLMVITPLLSEAHETEWPGEKLAAIFPKAKKFVQRNAVLTPEKIKSIEKELGAKLRKEDQKPIFYIPISDQKKPLGLVLFVDVKGPRGVIDGAVGLNMKGKVVKVAVYEHKESDAIASEKFLKQFIGKGIDDALTVGKDIEAIKKHEEASKAVALIPKKTLVMSYALFLKRKPKSDAEKTPQPEEPPEDIPEVEDLKELMILMVDEYFEIVDYFDEGEGKAEAVTAAKKLALYAKLISEFEPPKNADQTEEYVEMQDKFSKTLTEFAKALDKNGISDETRKQWDEIDALIKQAHIRFSEEEIDLEAY
jgi:Na+-translocating ferredoxin:NAD+ oxidoreductase RnfG subunit